MLKTIQRTAVCLACQLAFLLSVPARAQQPADPPQAPIPSPILDGKRAFISNASGESAVPTGVPDLTYNEFYAAIKGWGRYEVVSAPADADLVLEIRFTSQLGPVVVMSGGGSQFQDFQLRLTILDPKTHILLWAFTESVPQSGRPAQSRKNFDQAMAAIVADLKKLTTQAPTPNGSASK